MSFLDSRHGSAAQGFGKSVRRLEDRRLLTGQGRYSDDVSLPGQAYAHFVRSPHPHARIRRIDAGAAREVPGVIAVLAGTDAAADGLAPIPHRPVPTNPHEFPLAGRDGSAVFVAPHPPLPADRARFVGEAVAMVIAETAAAAADAAERVAVDYEPLPSVTATADAARAGAPLLWDDRASNVCVDSQAGSAAATDAAFARAAHVVRLETWVPRITGAPMEPRAALGVWDEATGRYTLYAGSGGVVRHKADLAEILGVPEAAVRVVARDVGGNFGTRNSFYPEFALVVWAARRLGRPVKWTCERREAFLTDYQARDLASEMELALGADGTFLALRGVNTSNVGAHAVTFVPLNKGRELATSVYRLPAACVRGRAVLSNTSPLAAYRSAGRPQVMFVMERLIDLAARRHGFDRLALRRRNLVPPGAMPYTNPFGIVYDSGDYAAAQDRAVTLADWAGFAARRLEARQRGRYRGIGIANYIEIATGAPRERAQITVRPEGRIDVVIGTLSAGQGHETTFAQLVAEWLGVTPDQVRLITGDTDQRAGRRRLALRALDAARRRGAREGGGPDRRPGPAYRGFIARGGGGGHRLRGAPLPGEGHRPRGRSLRRRRRRPRGRRAASVGRAARGGLRRDLEHAVVPVRLGRLRGRGRSGDGRGRDRPLHVSRRRRPRHQPDDRARPDARRHRPGRGAGAVGALPLRRRRRASCTRPRSWTTRSRAPTCCPRSRPRSARCHRRRTRSASAGAARAARHPPSVPWSTRSSTRSPSSAWSISRCR